MTVPNLITTIRIILTPVFIIYLINDQFLSAQIVFIICCLSDGIDGLVARLFNQKSKLGTYLDPLADKILLVAAYVVLAVRRFLPSWLTVMVISRDVLILLGVLMLYLIRTEVAIKPSMISKINTCFQFLTVVVVLSKDYVTISQNTAFYLYLVTALFTISSGLHYIHYWFKTLGEGDVSRNLNQ
jgi:cardiolipin synthase